jgi:hypothetical protein
MWILPKNYPLSCHFAQAMVESKEDLTLPGLNIESSVMWRSKHSQLRTWLQRWKRVSWMQHLCSRILKHSHHTCFETKLTSLLAATHAPHFQQQANEKAKTTPDTCGPIFDNISEQYDLLDACLKMSKVTYRLDSAQSLVIWKKMVTKQRGEYSARRKLAHRIEGKEYLSWPTPASRDWKDSMNKVPPSVGKTRGHSLGQRVADVEVQAQTWPTPRASEYKDCGPVGSKSHRHMDKRSYLCARAKNPEKPTAHLNPDWVEQLMGVPLGWTALNGTSNEWEYGWHDGSWEAGLPRVVEGCDDRVDRIRLLGNGVVPATAAKAWLTLTNQLRETTDANRITEQQHESTQ